MRKILIVGAGQAGLHLALGLQHHGYDVTVVSARTAEDIETGNVTSTQFQFASTLKYERELGIYFWDGVAPYTPNTRFMVGGGGPTPVVEWGAPLRNPGADIDQRVKMPRWLRLFEERGGELIVRSATVADIDRWAAEYDLVVVASGKGELAEMFERNAARSPYTQPQRMLSVVYVNGLKPDPSSPGVHSVDFHLLPERGEMIVMPALTVTGPCHILFFEAIPGGPLDVFRDVTTPEEHLARFVEQLRLHAPWVCEQYSRLELTDPGGTLRGGFVPTVRRPVATLPSGGRVLGIGDVVVANDPITGQGSNMAAKSAAVYLEQILRHGDRPFDGAFMERTFETFWERHGRATTAWTNLMLSPPPPHVQQILGAASEFSTIGDRYIAAFDDPNDFDEWFMDAGKASAYLAEVAGAAAGPR
ncbi:alanine-phosphoribitol ligase [Actinoplanes capillaceus]|uniref:Alanine-phosphoribitol ligase n=1 Tax=Actinoplanes campanulatus TaxID=113559 RepID=A0ABQ3WSR1_9ACTN|nr:styrene monooxygenase/indole monooxygenase family protein [Actinoplanes capillaceus]GID49214.1 alanine-phosphoribitol ligase [Actinoplanes capillaceus]